jgi:hypothetical protein
MRILQSQDRNATPRAAAKTHQRQLDGLITAITEGLRGDGLQQRLSALEAEKARLGAVVNLPAPSPIRLHPDLAEVYRHRVAALAAALDDEDGRNEALEIIRGLIERVAVAPAESGAIEIEIVGELAQMVEVALEGEDSNKKTALPERARRSVKVVAGARNHRRFRRPGLRIPKFVTVI